MGKIIPWTPEEDSFLTREYGTSSTQEIADALGRSPGGVRSRASRLELSYLKQPEEPVQEGYKYCRHCNEIHPLDDFYKKSDAKDGHYSICRSCCSKLDREKRDREKEKKLQQMILETNKHLIEREEWKNSQTFKCKACNQELKGENFSFNNGDTGRTVSSICNKCKSAKSAEILNKRIKDGKVW